jgi:hypothetical protein
VTEFDQKLRHFCRYPKCGSKLPAPIENHREAFCARGCHSAFYRHRCLVCEAPLERKAGNQLICGRRRCRSALQGVKPSAATHTPSNVKLTSETPYFIDPKQPLKPERGWSIVAGSEMTRSQLHFAIVGARATIDDVDLVNVAHWRAVRAGARGYRKPDALHVARLQDALPPAVVQPPDIPADLSIPACLRRTAA